MNKDLRKKWNLLANTFSKDQCIIDSLWIEIEKQYTLKIRHYHNLSHIESMLTQAETIKQSIVNYDAFLLAIWYHDIIYKPTKKDNEEKSGVLAKKRLKTLHIDEKTSKLTEKLIISTKSHKAILTENSDNFYLLDIDLSILGSHWETYQTYIQNIRKEYAIYPNFMYKKGRKRVLEHFLKRKKLFQTELYQTTFETKARENIKKELELY